MWIKLRGRPMHRGAAVPGRRLGITGQARLSASPICSRHATPACRAVICSTIGTRGVPQRDSHAAFRAPSLPATRPGRAALMDDPAIVANARSFLQPIHPKAGYIAD